MSDFSKIRPWEEIAPADKALLERLYSRLAATGEGYDVTRLCFASDCTREDIARLDRLDLVVEAEPRSIRPTALGLLYVDSADEDLRQLEALIGLAHRSYTPDQGLIEADEVSQLLHESDLPRLKLLAGDLSLVLNDDGTMMVHQRWWKIGGLEAAVRDTYRPQYADDAASLHGEPVDVLVPFGFRPTSVQTENFRALADFELEIAPLTTLIGPNAVGKSTVFDALTFLAAAARRGLTAAIAAEGPLARIRTQGNPGTISVALQFELEYDDDSVPGSYRIEVTEINAQPLVVQEQLVVGKRTLIDTRRGRSKLLAGDDAEHEQLHGAGTLAMSTLDNTDRYALQLQIRSALGKIVLIDRDPLASHDADLWPAAYGRGAAGAMARWAINPRGLLADIASSDQAMERLSDVFRELSPESEAVVRVVRTGEESEILVKETALPTPLTLDELSAGTRQSLLLAALYVHPSPPIAVLLEEPDAGVHPSIHAVLVDMLRSLSTRSTIVLTTHSPSFVALLDPEREVVALAREGVATTARPFSEAIRSSRWLKQFGSPAEAFARTRTDEQS